VRKKENYQRRRTKLQGVGCTRTSQRKRSKKRHDQKKTKLPTVAKKIRGAGGIIGKITSTKRKKSARAEFGVAGRGSKALFQGKKQKTA